MTDPRGHRPDPTPPPPVSTRWSEESAPDEEDGLAPPYVPARQEPPADSPADATPSAEAPAEEAPFPFELEEEPAGPEAEGDEFPVEAFDIDDVGESSAGGGEGAWDGGAGIGAPPAVHGLPDYTGEPLPGLAGASEPYDAAVPDSVREVAFELERIARLLRERGADGVTAELSSPDRLTAILAGVVAGYLTGRD